MHRQIYHISLLTALAVAALLSSACSADGNGELHSQATDQQPVAFDATMADGQEATTRAVPHVIDVDALKNGTGFGVFACYTGLHHYSDMDAQPDFMYNQQVKWQSNKWTYSPLKYWPNGEGEVNGSTGEAPHYVSFMAYAPYSDMNASTGDEGYCIPSMSLQHELGNPWITYRIHPEPMDHQVDLLYATPLLDKSKQATAGNLSFAFKHALACAGSEVTVKCSEAMKNYLDGRVNNEGLSKMELVLTGMTITYKLTEKGRLVLWSQGSANWQGIMSESSLVTRTVTYTPSNHLLYSTAGGGTDYENNDKGVFYIPIHVGNNYQTATVTLTYEVRRYTTAAPSTPIVDRTLSPSAVLTLSDYSSYEAGKQLTMNFTITDIGMSTSARISDWTTETVGNFVAE